MKKQTDNDRAKAAGLSRSQLNEAKSQGVDTNNPDELLAFRGRINHRSDSRNAPPREELSGESMTLEDMESALRSKGLGTNEARTLKIQLDGLKGAIALRQQMNQLLSRAECQENQSKTANALNAMYRAFENNIPALCNGKQLGEAKELVRKEVRKLQKYLTDAHHEFWLNHPET